jgi:O-antigen/teichoic acid export membrane protein
VTLKALQFLSMALFAIVTPRLMGPELFGRFVVILSLTALWMTTSNLGARFVFGRFMPEYASRGSEQQVRALFMHLLEFRILVSLVVAAPLGLFLRRVLPDASRFTLAVSVAAFVLMTVSSPMYNVFYGLNRLNVSLAREALNRYLLFALLVVLGGTASLERASVALLALHASIFGVGVWLCRDLFTLDRSAHQWPSFAEHIRFGLTVFAANLLLRLPWRLGESALALSGTGAAEIAFFNISLSAAVAYTRIMGSTITLQIPSLSVKQATGDERGRDRSLGLVLRYLTVLGVLFVLGVYATGPWVVRVLLGEPFLGVLPNLHIAVTAALPVPFIRTALSLAVVESRVVRNLQLGIVAVGVFCLSAWLLIPRLGSPGASTAVLVAIAAAAIVATWQMRRSGVLREARAGRQLLAAAAPAAVLAAAGIGFLTSLAAALLYTAIVFGLRIASWRELKELLEQSGRARRPAAVGPEESD